MAGEDINQQCVRTDQHPPHTSPSIYDKLDTVHCPGLLFDKDVVEEPSKSGFVSVVAEDGQPVELTAGSSLSLPNDLVLVIMTQDDFNEWKGTGSIPLAEEDSHA